MNGSWGFLRDLQRAGAVHLHAGCAQFVSSSLWISFFLISHFYSLSCKHVSCLTDTPQAEPQVWSWTLVMVWHTLSPYTRDSPFHILSCAWTSPDVTSPDTFVSSCARKATISTLLQSLGCAHHQGGTRLHMWIYTTCSLQLLLDGNYNLDRKRWKNAVLFSREPAIFPSTPEGWNSRNWKSTIYTTPRRKHSRCKNEIAHIYVSVWEYGHKLQIISWFCWHSVEV